MRGRAGAGRRAGGPTDRHHAGWVLAAGWRGVGLGPHRQNAAVVSRLASRRTHPGGTTARRCWRGPRCSAGIPATSERAAPASEDRVRSRTRPKAPGHVRVPGRGKLPGRVESSKAGSRNARARRRSPPALGARIVWDVCRPLPPLSHPSAGHLLDRHASCPRCGFAGTHRSPRHGGLTYRPHTPRGETVRRKRCTLSYFSGCVTWTIGVSGTKLARGRASFVTLRRQVSSRRAMPGHLVATGRHPRRRSPPGPG